MKPNFGTCLRPGRCACSWDEDVCTGAGSQGEARGDELRNAHQFTIETTSVAIEFVVEAMPPQRSVSSATARLSHPREWYGKQTGSSETCTGNIGGPGILGLDAQGRPLIRLGVNSGEGWEFAHGRSGRSNGSYIREGKGSGRSISLFRLVEGRNGLHINILELKVLMRQRTVRGDEDPGMRRGS